MQEQTQARRYFVSGIVQGVGYRFFAQRIAAKIGVAGFARNLSDGRVEVYAIGTLEQLRLLTAELRRGPRSAEVEHVVEEDTEIIPRFAAGFSIESGGW